MTNVNATFLNEDNALCRAGYILVPGANDVKDRQRLIMTRDDAREYLSYLTGKEVISFTKADQVMRQIVESGIVSTWNELVRQIMAFDLTQPMDLSEAVIVDVCSGCGEHANLILRSEEIFFAGSIEDALGFLWFSVQDGETSSLMAKAALKELLIEGPCLAIRSVNTPADIKAMQKTLANMGGSAVIALMIEMH